MRYNIQERSIPLAILFSIITCGIYGFYWQYKLSQEMDIVTERDNEISPGLVVLFSIITCGIFQIYWCYRQGIKLNEYYANRGVTKDQHYHILYLALAIATYFVGVTMLIAYCLMQDEINNIARSNGSGQNNHMGDYTYIPVYDIADGDNSGDSRSE